MLYRPLDIMPEIIEYRVPEDLEFCTSILPGDKLKRTGNVDGVCKLEVDRRSFRSLSRFFSGDSRYSTLVSLTILICKYSRDFHSRNVIDNCLEVLKETYSKDRPFCDRLSSMSIF
jgi:hypothetical protein